MKCCDLTAGKLRQSVSLQRQESAPDGAGGWTTEWVEYATVRAHLEALSSRERMEADRLDNPVRYRGYIRWRDDVHPNHRVLFRGRAYNIEGAYDPDLRRRYLQLDLQQGVAT